MKKGLVLRKPLAIIAFGLFLACLHAEPGRSETHGDFGVQATVVASCIASVMPVNIPNRRGISTGRQGDTTGALAMNCNHGVPYMLDIGTGQSPGSPLGIDPRRRMLFMGRGIGVAQHIRLHARIPETIIAASGAIVSDVAQPSSNNADTMVVTIQF